MRVLLLTIFSFLWMLGYSLEGMAQVTDKEDYALLWEISGNGLKAPSYLFGTMHVRDERAFDLPDSLYSLLEGCEAFAMEVHPDSLLKNIFAEYSREDTSFWVQKLLSEKELRALDARLQEQLQVSLLEVKNKDIRRMNDLIGIDIDLQNDRKVFLDAHLYYMARKLGKSVLGLEKTSDQLDFLRFNDAAYQKKILMSKVNQEANFVADNDRYFKELISLYLAGDIEKIHDLYTSEERTDTVGQAIMITRNYQMLESIDNGIQAQSSFIAVGALHLPGEEGLISLLRKEGYELNKVACQFTGKADEFEIKANKVNWHEFENSGTAYSIEMPNQPLSYEQANKIDLGQGVNVALDLGTGLAYFTTSTIYHQHTLPANKEKFIDRSAKDWAASKRMKIIKSRKKTIKNLPAREVLLYNPHNDNYSRVQMILRGNISYLNFVSADSRANLFDLDAERFFSSFELRALPSYSGYNLLSEEGGFELYFPDEPKLQNQSIPIQENSDSLILHLHHFVDSKEGISYLMRYNNLPNGKVIDDLKRYFNQSIDDMLYTLNGKLVAKKEILFQSYPAMEYVIDYGEGAILKVRQVLRGNRTYLQMVELPKLASEDKNVDKFFDSLKLLPLVEPTLKRYTNEDLGFEVEVPSLPKENITESFDAGISVDKTHLFNNLDRNSGILYFIEFAEVSPYYEIDNIDSLFIELKTEAITYQDSLLSERMIEKGDSKGLELLIQCESCSNLQKIQYWIHNEYLVTLAVYAIEEELDKEWINTFFDSFEITSPNNDKNLFTDKNKLLLSDIYTNDTTIRNKAKRAIPYYEFDKGDLADIYQAISLPLPDDKDQYNIKGHLIDVLAAVNDSNTVDFIKRNYERLPNDNNRLNALYVLAETSSIYSTETFKELLFQKTPLEGIESKQANAVFYPFVYDSIEHVKYLLPELCDLLEYEVYRGNICLLLSQAHEANVIEDAFLKANEKALLETAKADAALYEEHRFDLEKLEEVSTRLDYITPLLASLDPKPELHDLLKELGQIKHPAYRRYKANAHLLENEEVPEWASLMSLADHPLYRIYLWDTLAHYQKTKHFPDFVKTQETFAASEAMRHLYEMNELPDTIVLIKKKKIIHRKRKGSAYLFQFGYQKYGNPNAFDWYVGMKGIYAKKNKLKPTFDVFKTDFKRLESMSIKKHWDYLLNME